MSLSLDLASLSAAYDTGGTSPLDVVDEVFARLAGTPHESVFIHTLDHESVREAAREVMARKARGEALRLYGVPFVVKDNIDVADVSTTAACPEFSYVPTTHAACVERLLSEGAILIGKTNLDQFATGLVGVRSPYGIPANPFDARYVPGGSSSGSAVAVARGFCSFALATDTAGSGRVPAAFNGLVGLKPTRGMISAHGVVPACRSLDCVAVFAARVTDATEVAYILSGFDARDPYARPAARHWDPRPVAVPKRFAFAVPNASSLRLSAPYTPSAFAAVVEQLTRMGGVARPIDLTPFSRAAELLYGGPFVAERLEAAGALLERSPEAIEPTVRGILTGALRHGALDLLRAQHTLAQLRTECERLLRDVDLLVVPSAPTIPLVSDVLAYPLERNAELGTYTNFVNLLDLCALAVPAGSTPEHLPFGVTLIAPAGDDSLLAGLGQVLHHAFHDLGPITALPERSRAETVIDRVGLAVVGAHLTGGPLNHQLTSRGARLVRATRTAAVYQLFALATVPPKPGLVRVKPGDEGHAIELEVWELTEPALGSFLREVSAPLCIGSVELEDGSRVHGFLCEPAATFGQRDISRYGGWRAYLRAG